MVVKFVDWAESWIKHGVKEPDGFIGRPKRGTGGLMEKDLLSDSLVGEARAFRPVVLMAREIQRLPALKEKHGKLAEYWVNLAGQMWDKWGSAVAGEMWSRGGVWVAPEFGIDSATGKMDGRV